MNVVGLITEYNPFHNGHLYHFQEAKKLARADYVIAVMSGNFLQRGEPALVNKWARSKMAVNAGIDLVIEIPTAFATRSAPSFAFGAVALLELTGLVTHLCFGSEAGTLDYLLKVAKLLANEPLELSKLIKKHLQKGVIYPVAQNKALEEYLKLTGESVSEELIQIATSPNNILGIEYLKALFRLESTITPLTIKRIKNEYHDKDLPVNHYIASATSIREHLRGKSQPDISKAEDYLPSTSAEILMEEFKSGKGPIFKHNLNQLILYSLRINNGNLKNIVDVKEGLENRIIEAADKISDLEILIDTIKNKRYTWTRLQRILIHHLLNYTESEAELFQQTGPQYLRILAFNKKGQALLNIMKKTAKVPLVTKVVPFLKGQGLLQSMLELDIKATNLYSLLYANSNQQLSNLDLLQGPIRV